jgi:hypothetical protein
MAISYATAAEGDTLLVRATGIEDGPKDVRRFSEAMLSECVSGGFAHVLCDEGELGRTRSALEVYEAAIFVAANAQGVRRFAMVCDPCAIVQMAFWEHVASNRGLNARVFTEVRAAREWLGLAPLQAQREALSA